MLVKPRTRKRSSNIWPQSPHLTLPMDDLELRISQIFHNKFFVPTLSSRHSETLKQSATTTLPDSENSLGLNSHGLVRSAEHGSTGTCLKSHELSNQIPTSVTTTFSTSYSREQTGKLERSCCSITFKWKISHTPEMEMTLSWAFLTRMSGTLWSKHSTS